MLQILYSKSKYLYLILTSKKTAVVEEISKEAKEIRKEELTEKNYKETEENAIIEEDIWQIEIPKINLLAPIAEGTSQEVMLEYVGHFENTDKWNGNIGLAAHNRRLSN